MSSGFPIMKRALAFAEAGLLLAVLILGVRYFIFGWGLGRSDKTASYRLTGSWEAPGGRPFDQPYAIGVDQHNGDVLVTDAQNQRVLVFDPSGKFLREFGSKGEGPGQFALPLGIAVGPNGAIYAADYIQDRVQKFSASGQFLFAWRGSGSGQSQFHSPGGVAVDRQGQVYVADIFNHRISVFDSQGRPIRTIARHGQWRGGEFDYPADVDVADDGYLLVADTYNYRVQLLSRAGEPEAAWGWHLFWLWPRPAHGREGFGETASAAFGYRSGLIHAADAKDRRVVMLDENGGFRQRISHTRFRRKSADANPGGRLSRCPDGLRDRHREQSRPCAGGGFHQKQKQGKDTMKNLVALTVESFQKRRKNMFLHELRSL